MRRAALRAARKPVKVSNAAWDSQPANEGFTLIELLVVMVIVGILAGLVIPSLSGAKLRAQRTKCLNNVRQLQLAVQMYADDYGGELLPRSYRGGGIWVDRLESYYGSRALLLCPVDREVDNVSYLLNGFVDALLFDLSRAIQCRAYKSEVFGMKPQRLITLETFSWERSGRIRTGTPRIWLPKERSFDASCPRQPSFRCSGSEWWV